MTDPKKWWLISDEDVQTVKRGLTGIRLYTLETGLHKTDAVPDDWINNKDDKIGLDYVGCNLDLCPKEQGRLCCFECDELATCHIDGIPACDEVTNLREKGLTQSACKWYHSSAQVRMR